MNNKKNLLNYINSQRWCGFKQDIAQGNVVEVKLDSIPFDDNKKLFILGTAELTDGTQKKFFMPMAKGELDGVNGVEINGQKMYDATKAPDYWKSMMAFFNENNNSVKFESGAVVSYQTIADEELVSDNLNVRSRALNVEQSNTTIKVGDGIAFKQDRMIETDTNLSTEVEVNMKLMDAECHCIPQTYGTFIMTEPDGKMAALGVVQEFVPNQGDLWEYANTYLGEALNNSYAGSKEVINPKKHQDFVQLMYRLGEVTTDLSACMSKDNGNPDFKPEVIDDTYLHIYEKNMQVLLYKTKKTIEQNVENLSGDTKVKTQNLLANWDSLTTDFVKNNIKKIQNNPAPRSIVRVHGDYHLGQVLVTKDNDLKVIDFDGEPSLPIAERRMKYPETRDIAGMYRSINGYLGAVVAENFAAGDEDKKVWANKALSPIINASVKSFLNGRDEHDPLLSLEILRKNLYEVTYEVSNRPEMAYVPIKGLSALLEPETKVSSVEKSFIQDMNGLKQYSEDKFEYAKNDNQKNNLHPSIMKKFMDDMGYGA